MRTKNTTRKYELLLVTVIAARASSFILSKMILRSMASFNLLAVRFLLAFLLLGLLFFRQLRQITRRDLLSGMIIGTLFFMTMSFELRALTEADSSLVSLLENCSIIFVPLFGIAFTRKLPDRLTALSAVTAMLGVGCLALAHGSLRGGFAYGLLSGACYALAILATAKLTEHSGDTLCVGIVQVGTIGLLALFATLLFVPAPHLPGSRQEWLMLLGLSAVCTGFGFTLQPVAQSHVSAARAGLFCAVSPAIASLLGVLVLHERFTPLSIVGLALILGSITLPYLIHMKK
ncbi:MAG: DMT family transporter [Oscillospiraceae bacterium]|nr:DMT family transporter [Oscillospiraceae bacterium]